MPKRSSNAGSGGRAKRGRGLSTLESEWMEHLSNADREGCFNIKSKLEHLLGKANERISTLEEEEKNRGLNYDGDDKVVCECGNTFESGGDYGASCGSCGGEGEEKCIECFVTCHSSSCGQKICENCKALCASCEEEFCKDCLDDCCSCGEAFCGGDKDCEMLTVGYGGETSCKFCVEPH